MQNNFESLDNSETTVRKSSVVQERAGLVAVHMYKQFLDFQNSNHFCAEAFSKVVENMQQVVEYFKQSFSVRNIPVQNVGYEVDTSKTVAQINILWNTISFTSGFNNSPKALPRASSGPLFCSRILALSGNFNSIIKDAPDYESQMRAMLDNEIASLYIPAEKNQSAIITVRHKDNQEFLVSQIDAPREFLLKVIEIVCGGGQFHEQMKNKLF